MYYKQTQLEKADFSRINYEVAIVQHALKKRLSLAEVFQKLTAASNKLSWIDSCLRDSPSTDISRSGHELIHDLMSEPGNIQNGLKFEEQELWKTPKLLKTHMAFLFESNRNYKGVLGLSPITYRTGYWGPGGDARKAGAAVLTKVEPCYQDLLKAQNFFDCLQLSASLLFTLYNFPVLSVREKEITITFIINEILKVKFNLSFDLVIEPLESVAYFETENQFCNLFIISAVVRYCEALNIFLNPEAIKSLLNTLVETPSLKAPFHQKLNLWSKVKTLIRKQLVDSRSLQLMEKNCLQSIIEGKLTFKRVSKTVLQYTNRFSEKDFNLQNFMASLPEEEKKHFETLIELNENILEKYLESIGEMDKKSQLEALWDDLLCLQSFGLCPLPKKTLAMTPEMMEVKNNPICLSAFIDPDNLHQFRDLLALCKGHEKQILTALQNGLSFHDLNSVIKKTRGSFLTRQRMILNLSSRATCILYSHDLNLTCFSFTGSLQEMEMKILGKISTEFCGKLLNSIPCSETRKLLLNCLELQFLKYKDLDQLIGRNTLETRRNLIAVWAQVYNLSIDQVVFSKLTYNQTKPWINTMTSLDRNSIKDFDFTALNNGIDIDHNLITLNRVQKLESLGAGSYGEVFKCTLDNRPKFYAIKILNSGNSGAAELGIMAVLTKKRIPHTLSMIGAVKVLAKNQVSYNLIMTYAENGDLYSHIKKRSLNFSQELNIKIDIATGLKYMHDLNILHNDIRARNVLLDVNYRAFLCDFGRSARVGYMPSDFCANSVCALEVHENKRLSKKSDVYSMGLTFWHMWTKEMPYAYFSREELPEAIVSQEELESLPNNCPKPVKALLTQCISLSPEDRPEASEVQEALQTFRSGASLSA